MEQTEAIETIRIQPGDCLYELLENLQDQARYKLQTRIEPWDWMEAAASVLSQVPDRWQRLSWAVLLGEAVQTPERPWNLVARHLMLRAETIHHG